jgi:serine-type D-Ala-D-Ala carboxypeptidase/endopeptidase (penicillin-binding protein 4)
MFRTITKISLILHLALAAAAVAGSGELTHKINRIVTDKSVSSCSFSVNISNPRNGQTVSSYQPQRKLIPASNMKLITTSAALDYLGSDYVFNTWIYFHGGELIIQGSGDPLLGDAETNEAMGKEEFWEIKAITDALKSAGIKSVKNICVNSFVFDHVLIHPSWPPEQLNRYYEPEVCGINYNGNCITIRAGNNGRLWYTTVPGTDYVKISSKASITSSGGNTLWCSRLHGTNNMTLYGKCRSSSVDILVTISNPAMYLGMLVGEALLEEGIDVQGSILEKYCPEPENTKPLITFSHTLKEVMTRCNRDSFNLAAECLIKTISAENSTHKINGEWPHGLKLTGRHLEKLGFRENEDFELDDGCGLSRENLVTSQLLCSVLNNIYNSPESDFFFGTLAVGGIKGSAPVRRYFTQPDYKGKILAKSGTINGVKALSGMCRTDSGDYTFSIIVNNANGHSRNAINEIVKAVIDCM